VYGLASFLRNSVFRWLYNFDLLMFSGTGVIEEETEQVVSTWPPFNVTVSGTFENFFLLASEFPSFFSFVKLSVLPSIV